MEPALTEGAGKEEEGKVETGLMTSRPAGLHRVTGMAVPAKAPIRAGTQKSECENKKSPTVFMPKREDEDAHGGQRVELRHPEEAMRKRGYPSGRETGPSVK